ncbi:MAG: NADH-quinone oxidoreductase subunit H, partial [SAR324 cluster bacterium]|nr:NADH-quinone oxidoreductase subunit H [SAR324 cluster bacterium]
MSTNPWEVESIAQRAASAFQQGHVVSTVGYLMLGLLLTASLMTVIGIVLIYAERKVAAHFQCRLGPMRVGWHGVLQPLADAVKLMLKEDLVPAKADKILHLLAPYLSLVATVLTLAIIPLSPSFQVVDLNIGIVYVLAVTGVGVFGVLVGGWSSNNKWSMLGAMRAGAQIISYEVSATLSLLVIVMLAGSLKLSDIVMSQADGWWIWKGHGVSLVAFLLFLISSTAELNRTPFDLPEEIGRAS